MAKKEQGLSLNDIAPAFEWVTIGYDETENEDGTKTRIPRKVKMHGVGAKSLVILFARFPQMGQWFKGGKTNFQQFISEAPDAVNAVIAAALGFIDNVDAEEAVGLYGIETQLDALEAIARLTFKNGFGPFAQRIVDLAQSAASQNYGRAPVTKSPQASRDSLTVDIRPPTPGDTPLDK